MRHRLYYILLLVFIAGIVLTGLILHTDGRYWIWSLAGLVLYIWCKDVFTGQPWFGRMPSPLQRNHGISEEAYQLQVLDYPAAPGDEQAATGRWHSFVSQRKSRRTCWLSSDS